MAIYRLEESSSSLYPSEQLDLFGNVNEEIPHEKTIPLEEATPKDKLVSALMARLLFFVLMVMDFFWLLFNICSLTIGIFFHLASFAKSKTTSKWIAKAYLSLKRSTVCFIALVFALFCPGFGITVACAYFLMFDRNGIDECVPASLKIQFQEFFKFM